MGIFSLGCGALDEETIKLALGGCRRSLARTLTEFENSSLTFSDVSKRFNLTQPIHDSWNSLAITGPPGVGKSCLIDKILVQWASKGMKVAVLAIDPSSPRSGGALLGDRIRITATDDEKLKDLIYIRSVATRRSSGSVPIVVEDMIQFLIAAGWQKVLVETVGSGQSEVRCAAVADRIVVVEGPARGDGIQAEKAGLLELADSIIVNKSDLDGAQKHANELQESLDLGLGDAPPVMLTSALTGIGIEEVSSLLLTLPALGRSNKAKWRERILAYHERKILHSAKLDETIELLSAGSISLDDAISIIGSD